MRLSSTFVDTASGIFLRQTNGRNTVSAGFDMTIANLNVGLCLTSGAADAITIQTVLTEVFNL